MRLLTEEQLENELLKAGLEKTEIQIEIARLWKCPNGLFVTVPVLRGDTIGDYILDDILRSCGVLYRTSQSH